MEILGAASAAVGLADVLFKTSLQCYDILSETADTSVNHDHFVWQLNTEKHRLIRWENSWGLTNDLDRNLDPGQYRYAVGTLARIVSLFTSADDLRIKYGIQASNSSQQSGPSAPSKSWLSVRLRRLQRSPSPSGGTKKPGASEILPGLDASDIRALENPSILENKGLVPGLTEEIKRIQESTGRMQQMLPLYRKLRWAVVDKTRSSHLIRKLKEYNDGLVAILPGPQSPQNTPSTDCQPFLRFHVPIQLPRQRNQNFRGREDLLSEMSTILNPKSGATSHQAGQIDYGPTKKHRIAVLHGLGGMGKSQIATEYAYRHHSSSSYASIFWIDATSQTSLAQSAVIMIEQIIAYYQKNPQRSDSTIEHIGTILGLSGCIEPTGTLLKDAPSASVIKAAKRWLSEPENKDWLIIFDNNDDIDSVKVHDFLPKLEFDHGSTIITTRRPELRCLGTGVEIDEIEENAAIRILLTSAGKPSDTTEDDEDYAEARNISKRLGYFPLALDQAGGYISSKQIPISNYLPLYTANYKRVASKSHRKSVERGSHDTVYTTWKISFDSLPKPASELLLLCSFLGGVDISEELLFRGKDAVPRLFEDDSLADDALDPLLSFSLARRKIDTQSTTLKLSFHPLVLEWARESLDANDRCGFMEQAICLVGATYQHGLGEHRTMDEWVFGMKILHHINIAVENTQYLLKSNNTWTEETILAIARVAGHCRCHNLVEPAIGILETPLSSLLADGEPSSGMGEAMVELMSLYRKSAQVEKFLELGKKHSKSAETWFGNDHPYVVKIKYELCFMLLNCERYEESLESFEVLLPISERVLGKEHSTTLHIGSLIIFCLMCLGRDGQPPEAQRLLSAINEKELEKGHPQTLVALHNSTRSLNRLDRYEGSVEISKRLVADREKVLGHDHPETLDALFNLAVYLASLERFEESMEIQKRVVAGREKVLGHDHPETLGDLHNLASYLASLERFEESIEIEKRVVAGREKVLGHDQPQTLDALYDLAISLASLGRFEESMEIFKRLVAGREKVLGHDHPETLDALSNLAACLSKLERFEESIEIGKRVVAGREKVLGHDHPGTLNALSNLASPLARLERFEESIEIRKRVAAGREKVLGHDHPGTLSALSNLASSLSMLERFEESIEIGKRVVAGREKVLGHDHPQTLDALYNLAVFLSTLERFEESMEIEKRVVAGREKVLGHDHPETLDALSNLAASLYRLERFEESIEIRKRVAAGREKILGHDHPQTFDALYYLAASLSTLERFEESIEIGKRVVAGREKVLGHDHPQTLDTLYSLAVSLARLGRFEGSMEIGKRVVAGREKVLGHDHPETLDALSNLAVSLSTLERFEESIEISKRVVAGREKVLGHDHPQTLDALYNLAISLSTLERFEESIEISRRVVAGREKVLGHDHPQTLKAIQNLNFYLNKVHRAVGGATSKVKTQSVDLEGKEETSKSSS